MSLKVVWFCFIEGFFYPFGFQVLIGGSYANWNIIFLHSFKKKVNTPIGSITVFDLFVVYEFEWRMKL